MRLFLVIAVSFWACLGTFGQQIAIPNPTLPRPSSPVIPNPLHNQYNTQDQIDKTNEQIKQDVENHERRKEQDQQRLKKSYCALGIEETTGNANNSSIRRSYPINTKFGKIHFEEAFNEINDMIEGRKPYSLKRSIFLTEYPYDTTLNYIQFSKQISKLVSVIQLELKQSKISQKDNLGKIMAAYKFMADTIRVRNPVTEKIIITYPKTYDFDDFYGMKDYSKLFVTKLVRTGTGQCHSLPLLFLILCQEINANAYLAYAPEHSYVKFKDPINNLHNIELTNQMFTTDQHVLVSGYIKAAAVKSKAYMDTLSFRQVVIHSLNDLANSYVKKYGYDDFALKCAQRVIDLEPNSIHAYMHLANYYGILGSNIEKQYQAVGIKNRQHYFRNDVLLQEIAKRSIYYSKVLDELGYAEMPPDVYSNWLGLLKDESMRQQHLERKRLLTNMLEYK